MMNDSQDGKAICKHCNIKFHIQNQICNPERVNTPVDTPAPDSDDQAASAPRPPPNSNELGDRAYAIAQSGDYELAKDDQAMCTYPTQHCVLCNKFTNSSRAYTSHRRHYHQAALQGAISLGLQRCRQYNAMTTESYVYCLHTAGSLGGAAHH